MYIAAQKKIRTKKLNTMHKTTTDNYVKLHLYLFYVPVILVALVVFSLYQWISKCWGLYTASDTFIFSDQFQTITISKCTVQSYPIGRCTCILSFLTILIVLCTESMGALITISNNFSNILYPYKVFYLLYQDLLQSLIIAASQLLENIIRA